MRRNDFLDLITLISFCVSLQNLDLNIAQDDLDSQTAELDRRLRGVVNDIHAHLQEQDKKLEEILNANHKETVRDDH